MRATDVHTSRLPGRQFLRELRSQPLPGGDQPVVEWVVVAILDLVVGVEPGHDAMFLDPQTSNSVAKHSM